MTNGYVPGVGARGAHGLSPFETVVQSALIHPEWTEEDHRSYLVYDEFFDAELVAKLPLEAWLFSLGVSE